MGGEKEPVNIVKSRSCTDILCIILFIGFILVWGVVGLIGFLHGNPEQLIYPSNSKGEICGQGEFANKTSVFYHDLAQCLKVDSVFGCSTPSVCVEECPQKTTSLYAYSLFLQNGAGALSQLSSNFLHFDLEYQRQFCTPELTNDEWQEAKGIDGKGDGKKLENLINKRKCPAYTLHSTSMIGRCLPHFGLLNENDVEDEDGNHIKNGDGDITVGKVKEMIHHLLDVLNARGLAEEVWADVVSSQWMILAGVGISALVSVVWIMIMRYVASIMIWLSLGASILLLAISSVYTWLKYITFENADTKDDKRLCVTHENGTHVATICRTTVDLEAFTAYLNVKETWLVLFIISLIFLVIIVLIVIFLRKRLMLAIAMINESSKAVGSILSSLLFPLVLVVLQLIVLGWFVLVCMYLASSSEQQFQVVDTSGSCPQDEVYKDCNPKTYNTSKEGSDKCECLFTKYGPNVMANYLQLYNMFGLFWGLCFVTALGQMVLAGAFSSWYWVLDKGDIPAFPVTSSFTRTLRYHTGTLAFGSLIIAIIKMIRKVVQFIEDKLKEKGADIFPVKVVMCLCKCCLWCLEKFMKFINRNAYILTAIKGTNFCKSAKDAFSLITRNCVRVAVIDNVTDFLLFLGKLVVTITMALLAFTYFSGGISKELDFNVQEPKLNFYFVPVAIITIGAYFTASVFFSVYAMAVDTMFLCCMVDMEQNDGSVEKPYYMSKSLRSVLELKQKKLETK